MSAVSTQRSVRAPSPAHGPRVSPRPTASPEQNPIDNARPRSSSFSAHPATSPKRPARLSPLGRTMSMDSIPIDPELLGIGESTGTVAGTLTDNEQTTAERPAVPHLPPVNTLAAVAANMSPPDSRVASTVSSSNAGHAYINGNETSDYLESPLSDSSFAIPVTDAKEGHEAGDVPAPAGTVKKSHARKQPAGHIKRARNAFILFRKHITDSKLIPATVEVKHQNISVVAAKMWKEAPQEVRAKFQEMARIEKEEHARLYPGYRYQPVFRRTDIVRRRVRKDPSEDDKVDAVADALMQGKAGNSLEKEIKDQMLPTPDTTSDSGLSSAARSRSRRRRDPGQMSKGAIKAQKAQARQKQMRANLLGHNLLTVSMYNAAQQQAEAQQRAAALAAEQQYHEHTYSHMPQDAQGQVYDYHTMHHADAAYGHTHPHAGYPADMYRLPSVGYDHLAPQDQAHYPSSHVQSQWNGIPSWDAPAQVPATYDTSMGLAMYASDYARPSISAPQEQPQASQTLPPLQADHQVFSWRDDDDVPSRAVGLVDEGLFGGELVRDEGLEDFDASVQQANGW